MAFSPLTRRLPSWVRPWALIGAACAVAALSARANTSVLSDDFSDGNRDGWYSSASSSSIIVTNNALVQVTGTGGRSTLTYFPVTSLAHVGDSITLSFKLIINGPSGTAFATASNNQLRFGLFNTGGATKVAADNYGSSSYKPDPNGTAAQYDFGTQHGYAAVLSLLHGATNSDSSPAGWTVRSRTADTTNLALISTTTPYTAVGATEFPTGSFAADTAYTVSLKVLRTADGSDIVVTVAGGEFASGVSFTRSDTSNATVTAFDMLAVHLNSNVAASFTIDDVQVVSAIPTPVSITTQPASQTVNVGESATFTVVATGDPAPTYQWKRNDVDLPGATNASLVISSAQTTDAGSYTVVVANASGSVTSNAATLTVNIPVPVAPSITTQPQSTTIGLGGNITLTVAAAGTAPLAYQWKKDGVDLGGATSASLALSAVTEANAGSYTVVVTNSIGSVTSDPAVLTINTTPGASSYLANLSVRASMNAQQTLIAGFVVTGGSKSVLLRAAGPGLVAQKVTSVLADPKLTLYNADGAALASNDNWDSALADTFVRLGAFPFTAGSKDAALLDTVGSVNTAHAPSGAATGIQLVELYDAGENNGVKLVNVSARNRVGTGDNILIAGFVIAGEGKKQVLIRGIGPGLAAQNVTGVLADPKLTLYRGSDVVASNDNWDATLAPTFSTLGAFALEANSKDAALLVELDPGVYTAQVAGADGGTGEALVEIYDAAP